MPRLPRFRWILATALVLPFAAYGLLALLIWPSNDREWTPDQARLATATFVGDSVHIENVRNAVYRSVSDYDVRWERRSYDLRDLSSVRFVVEPFSKVRGPAHTFLSFGFGDSTFVAMLERANRLAEHLEFYNTLWSSCTTNIVSHINDIAPKRVPFSFKVLLPAYSDELAYDLGLLETDLPREEFRLPHLVNARAAAFADRDDFSLGIRGADSALR